MNQTYSLKIARILFKLRFQIFVFQTVNSIMKSIANLKNDKSGKIQAQKWTKVILVIHFTY